jgi:hypothetical protein
MRVLVHSFDLFYFERLFHHRLFHTPIIPMRPGHAFWLPQTTQVQEIAMYSYLSNPEFFATVVTLAVVAVLAVAAFFDTRKRRTPPFLNYSGPDKDQFDRDNSSQSSFAGSREWHSYDKTRLQAYGGRGTTSHNGPWK